LNLYLIVCFLVLLAMKYCENSIGRGQIIPVFFS